VQDWENFVIGIRSGQSKIHPAMLTAKQTILNHLRSSRVGEGEGRDFDSA